MSKGCGYHFPFHPGQFVHWLSNINNNKVYIHDHILTITSQCHKVSNKVSRSHAHSFHIVMSIKAIGE